jgi:hypothetical protein
MAEASPFVGRGVLSEFQRRVARLFFSDRATKDFALAGGAAMIVRGQIDRETDDLDFFADARSVSDVRAAVDAFERSAGENHLAVNRIQVVPTFARLEVTTLDIQPSDAMLVDIAVDRIEQPPSPSELGPTLTGEELAANKVLALYGRMESRDFEDVWALSRRFPTTQLLDWAAEKDPGFDRPMFAESLGALDRYPDRTFTIEGADVDSMRTFFADLRSELEAASDPPDGRSI